MGGLSRLDAVVLHVCLFRICFATCVAVAPNTYSGVRFGVASDNGEFMNHSCNPNCVVITDELWIAARDIALDEEVTYDYAVSETTDSTHMPFDCRCGASCCRGRITGEDCLKPEVIAKYAGHFTSLVVDFQKARGIVADSVPAAGAAEAGGAAAGAGTA